MWVRWEGIVWIDISNLGHNGQTAYSWADETPADVVEVYKSLILLLSYFTEDILSFKGGNIEIGINISNSIPKIAIEQLS